MCHDVYFCFISYWIFRMNQWAVLLFSSPLCWWDTGAEKGEETFPGSAWLLILLYLVAGFLWPILLGSGERLCFFSDCCDSHYWEMSNSQSAQQPRQGHKSGDVIVNDATVPQLLWLCVGTCVQMGLYQYFSSSFTWNGKELRIGSFYVAYHLSLFLLLLLFFHLWVRRRRPALRKWVQFWQC